MDPQPDRPPRPSRRDDPERAVVIAVRWGGFMAMSVPVALAALAASATGEGLPLAVAWPLATLALLANVICWLKVIILWRALPRPEDDQGWGRWRDDPPP